MILNESLKKVSEQVHPLRDRVLVQRLEYEHPILAVCGITLQKGVVVAVGPGRKIRRKVRFDLKEGHLTTAKALYFEDGDETGNIRPMRVKVGDVVEFSPRNQIEWNYDGDKFVWIWEQSIYWITDDSKHKALLWQQSGGHDRSGNYLPGTDP